jgi:ADP-ribose pyrophosphatase
VIEYKNEWFSVIRDENYYFIDEPKSMDSAAILLRWKNKIVLVEQYRPAIRQSCIEIPRGYAEPGESSLDCAIREVYEETGFHLTSEMLTPLGYLNPNSAILTSSVSIYYGQVDAIQNKEPLSNEIDRCIYPTYEEFCSMIFSGAVTDGFTISAFALAILKTDIAKT